jgi:predicted transcriptional regulator
MSLTETTTSAAPEKSPPLRRVQIREVLQRHHGSLREIALNIAVTPTSVSQYLSGRMRSKRIEEACRAKALQLLEQETQQHAAQTAQ